MSALPPALSNHPLTGWIRKKGWDWFTHQIDAIRAAESGQDFIVFAPTGAGKTLSGFLPSLVDLHENGSNGKLHTLYISPLKALAVDVHRNIGRPAQELGLNFTYETRTGDTPQSRRQRQKNKPPDILMTTPESLALLLSYADAQTYFKHLKYVIVDELHAFLHTKRADLLSLNLERLSAHAPSARRIGLSATLADKDTAKDWLCRKNGKIIEVPRAVRPEVEILHPEGRMPWSGHSASYAVERIYALVQSARMTVIFVNTRAQAEFMFQSLWEYNEDNLGIGIHHGSLEKELRRKVEAHMASGQLNCVVATGSLDLGLDWAEVDLVIQIGAPKGVSRLLQRIGRSNHRLNEPSRAVLVPTNRLEYVECLAAIGEIGKGALDGLAVRDGGLDVLAQHIFATACSGPFYADLLYGEVCRAWPYRRLTRKDFDDVLHFVKDGGYALQSYERFSRLIEDAHNPGHYALRNKADARRYRMNIGTIVEAPLLKVMVRARTLGKIEESFVQNLSPGDTFLFGGRVLEFESAHNAIVKARPSKDKHAQIPSYAGGRMPLSTHLAEAVRGVIGDPEIRAQLPEQVGDWLKLQSEKSLLPGRDKLVIETFPRKRKHYMAAYTFAGWNANQTLGFLVMRRMKRMDLKPLGFVMTDYALTVWSFKKPENPAEIFNPGLMYEEFEEWLFETPLIKRLFRDGALISGLIERRFPGREKTGRQILASTDLIYDALMKYEPDHVLLRAAYQDAQHALVDADRVRELLHAFDGKIEHRALKKISPFAVPSVLQINRETLNKKDAEDYALEDMEAEILREAGLDETH